MRARARARHARPSRLRTLTCTAGLSTAVAVPLLGLTAAPAAAAPAPVTAGTVTAGPVTAAVVTASLPAAHPVTAPVGRATLRQGARGEAVADLQRRLGGIAADGAFGPVTAAAVRSFQASRGLAVDAVVGPRTWGALDGRPAAARASRGGQRTAPAAPSAAASSSTGAAAVAEASKHAGKPYRYGATGPGSFDCSGFVQYVYRQVGVSLPRTSAQQAAAARPVARGSEQLGDLIIFRSGGRVTHVGIYAGDGTMWVARRAGTTITRQAIYSSTYSVGRVG